MLAYKKLATAGIEPKSLGWISKVLAAAPLKYFWLYSSLILDKAIKGSEPKEYSNVPSCAP